MCSCVDMCIVSKPSVLMGEAERMKGLILTTAKDVKGLNPGYACLVFLG